MRFRILALAALCAADGLIFAQDLPLLDLPALLRAVESRGPDFLALRAASDAARAQHELQAAKLAPSLQAAGSLGASLGLGDKAAASSALSGAAPGLGGSGQASLSFGLPLTKASLQASQSLPSPESGTAPTTSLSLSLSQTMWEGYPGGSLQAAFDKSLLTYRLKEAQALQSRSKLLGQAKEAYIAQLAAQRAVELARGLRERQERLLAQVQALARLGQATELERRKAELDARAAVLDEAAAAGSLRAARRKLALLMGEDPEARFSLAELPDPLLPAASLEAALAQGLAGRSDAAQLELQRKQAEIELRLARGQAGLSWTLQAGLGVALKGGDSPAEAGAASLGLKLGLPLLDGGALAAQEAAAAAQFAALDAQTAALRRSIAGEIAAAYETAILRRDRLALESDRAALAEAKLAVTAAQFERGAASLTDRLDAQAAVATAQNAKLKAGNDYLLAVLALESAMGMQ